MTRKIKGGQMKTKLIALLIWVPIVILLVSFIALEIYVWVKYGNMPYGETPNWVQWLMGGRR